jgi:D-alanyl-D-alanine carboxypeptidase
MRLAHISAARCLSLVGLVAALTIAGSGWDQSHARAARKHPTPHAIHGSSYHPPYAAVVLDDKTGQVLHETSADEPRHPASLTKIMTLYLLFEQLEAGKLALDTPLPVSAHAAVQPPTKLGLKPNSTIAVEDAIKGLVTKSANDAAVVVAEAIGGSEEEFAKLMTAKAKSLGMTGTTYVNASGLPAEEQITTARDQALLGCLIGHRFPGYYQYFATPNFRYRGVDMHNHNSLLGQVNGVDGIKTGYTEASGYNLVSSVRRDDKHIVAVVLGGTSNAARDARMRQLIEQYIVAASVERTAPVVVEGTLLRAADPVSPFPPVAEDSGRPDAAARQAKVYRPAAAKAQAAKLTAGASKQAVNGKIPPNRAHRATAKASTLGTLRDISAPAMRPSRQREGRLGSPISVP